MTEDQWNAGQSVREMLAVLSRQGGLSERKARLFMAGCCRALWPQLADKRSRQAVEVAERYADGESTRKELRQVTAAAQAVYREAMRAVRTDPTTAPVLRAAAAARFATILPRGPRTEADVMLRTAVEQVAVTAGHQAPVLLRDIAFREVHMDPRWLTDTVKQLALAAYQERKLPEGWLDAGRLAVLADALEEAGAGGSELVAHLRQQGSRHFVGCWCVDLLLNRA